MIIFLHILLLIFFVKNDEYNYVTYTSAFKLKNYKLGGLLYSGSLSYQSGSGQQAVTAVKDENDLNSYWQILSQHGSLTTRGTPVPCDAIIRLKHIMTKKYLHSHAVRAALTKNQEVSAYGSNEKGDGGDNWYVRCSKKNEFWVRSEPVLLEHVDTGNFLAMSGAKYSGVKGQYEVVAIDDDSSLSAKWDVDLGVFFAPEIDDDQDL